MAKQNVKTTNESSEPDPIGLIDGEAMWCESLPIASIDVADQARKNFDPDALGELQESIRTLGVLQPIIVLDRGEGAEPRHLLISGERRYRAAVSAERLTISAMIYPAGSLDDKAIAKISLAENFHRRDLNHVETAEALGSYRDAGATVREIADAVHKSPDWVREHLDMLRLDRSIQRIVASGRLPLKQAAMIARIGDTRTQIHVARSAIGGGYLDRDRPLTDVAADGDYVASMRNLREEIGAILKTLGSQHWPTDVEYAGRPPCVGCADNTATETDRWSLIKMPGKSKKGNCTNEDCFVAKAEAWAKSPEKKARDRRLAAEKKKRDAKKTEKAAAAGGNVGAAGGSPSPYEPCDVPPETQYIDALRSHCLTVAKIIGDWLEDTAVDDMPKDAAACCLRVLDYDCSFGLTEIYAPSRTKPPIGDFVAALAAGDEITVPNDLAGYIWSTFGLGAWELQETPELLDVLEALAARWGLAEKLPARPTVEQFEADAKADAADAAAADGVALRREMIKRGKHDPVVDTLGDCRTYGDLVMLRELAADGLKAKWRTEEVKARIFELGAELDDAISMMRSASKKIAEPLIENCEDLGLLIEIRDGDPPLTGDWRCGCVARRIEAIKAGRA